MLKYPDPPTAPVLVAEGNAGAGSTFSRGAVIAWSPEHGKLARARSAAPPQQADSRKWPHPWARSRRPGHRFPPETVKGVDVGGPAKVPVTFPSCPALQRARHVAHQNTRGVLRTCRNGSVSVSPSDADAQDLVLSSGSFPRALERTGVTRMSLLVGRARTGRASILPTALGEIAMGAGGQGQEPRRIVLFGTGPRDAGGTASSDDPYSAPGAKGPWASTRRAPRRQVSHVGRGAPAAARCRRAIRTWRPDPPPETLTRRRNSIG